MAAISPLGAMIAVVQQDDIASTNAAQAVNDPFSRLREPITTGSRPHYDSSIGVPFANSGVQLRPSVAERGTHPTRVTPDGGGKRTVASLNFIPDAPCRKKCEAGMSVGVISDCMAPSGNIGSKLGKGSDSLADLKKGGPNPVLVEQVKQFGCDRGIRPVVKCKSNDRGISRTPQRRAEQLGRRRNGGPGQSSATGTEPGGGKQTWNGTQHL